MHARFPDAGDFLRGGAIAIVADIRRFGTLSEYDWSICVLRCTEQRTSLAGEAWLGYEYWIVVFRLEYLAEPSVWIDL